MCADSLSSAGLTASCVLTSGVCAHCGLAVRRPGDRYCCPGCEVVAGVIGRLGLTHYYDLRERAAEGSRPAAPTGATFAHFDDPDFIAQFTRECSPGVREVALHLEAMHCAACIWLLEKVPGLLPGIVSARVEFGRFLLRVRYAPAEIQLSRIGALLDSLGYPPRPIREGDDSAERAADRLALMRLGTAAFSFSNIMLLAVSLYGGEAWGIEPGFRALFVWVSAVLALPTLTFSAWPLYRAAFGGLRRGMIHIDLPITIAIIAGVAASGVEMTRGGDQVYFDSLTALIFLLLAGRWMQHRTVRRISASGDLFYAVAPAAALRVRNGVSEEVFAGSLEQGDLITIRPGERVPVDGRAAGPGRIDISLLTGESAPQPVAAGDPVFAGTRNVSEAFNLTVERTGEATRLGRLIRSIEDSSRSRPAIELLLNRVSPIFTMVVLLAAMLNLALWLPKGADAAVATTLALLVVTCPCVFALATPLAFSMGLHRAARSGALLKGADLIERLTTVRHIVFDKTGTLTEGAMAVRRCFVPASDGASCEERSALPVEVASAVAALESGVTHPIAASLRAQAGGTARQVTADDRRVIPGAGVEGLIGGDLWRVGSERFVSERAIPAGAERRAIEGCLASRLTPVLVSQGRRVVAVCGLGDDLRSDAPQAVWWLQQAGFVVHLVSGDRAAVVERCGAELGLPAVRVRAEVQPEEKIAYVRELEAEGVMMVGDGVNDAGALAAASVGVAVSGGAELAARVAHIYLSRPDIRSVQRLIEGAGRTVRVVRRNLVISAVYNLVGGAGAMLGLVGPLQAAVLMPLSSLTVIALAALTPTFEAES